jgi:hypothetical protein
MTFIFTWVLCNYALPMMRGKTKQNKTNKGLHLETLLFLDVYKIQIVQKASQLPSKGPPLF